MKKSIRSLILIFGLTFAIVSFAAVTPCNAWQDVIIPYGYVGDGWDSVIVISNISSKAINPAIVIVNADEGVACAPLAELGPGEIYVNTFGAITGWCPSGTPPIPGIFQIYVGTVDLGNEDRPFGVSIAINNASFGGFGFQQYKSEPGSEPVVFLACACTPPT